MTESARRGQSEEITILAHDLANHLTPIRGRVELIRRRASQDERKEDVADADDALRAVERIQRLMDDLIRTQVIDRSSPNP